MGALRGRTRYPGLIDPKAGWHGSPPTWAPNTTGHTLLAWYQFNFGGMDSGNSVTELSDLSGNGNDLTVTGTDGGDIQFFDNADGWPYIIHPGSGDKHLVNTDFVALSGDPRTFVVVGQMDSDSFLASLGQNTDCGKIFALTNNHTVTWCDDIDFADITPGVPTVAFFIYDGSNLQVYSNNTQLVTDGDPGHIIDTTSGIALLGWNVDGSFIPLEKRLYAVAAWDGAFNALEITKAVTYFQALYPIPAPDWTPDQATSTLMAWIEVRSESYSDTDTITVLHDLSSNSLDVTQVNSGTVVFTADDGNGHPFVSSPDGAILSNDDFPQLYTDSRTMIVVGQFEADCILVNLGNEGNTGRDFGISENTLFRWSFDATITNPLPEGQTIVVTVTYDHVTERTRIYYNDNLMFDDDSIVANTAPGYQILGWFNEDRATELPFYGLAVWHGVLTNQERVNAVSYFQQLYS